jgi:hypothetical protein
MYVINKINQKYLLISCIFLNGLCLYLFTVSSNVGFLFFIRIMTGFFQVNIFKLIHKIRILLLYIAHQYGLTNLGLELKKTIMMSLLQLTGPLGIVLGYLLTALLIIGGISWTISFIIQAIIYATFSIALSFTPSIYYSAKLHCINPYIPEKIEKSDNNQDKDKIRLLTI